VARLILARRARTELLALDWPLIDAAEEALALLQREPHAGYPLRGRLRGLYSLRVGSYRIVYQLSDNNKTICVATIRHRSVATTAIRASDPATPPGTSASTL
jgi:mRNA interferase RelE/StbE